MLISPVHFRYPKPVGGIVGEARDQQVHSSPLVGTPFGWLLTRVGTTSTVWQSSQRDLLPMRQPARAVGYHELHGKADRQRPARMCYFRRRNRPPAELNRPGHRQEPHAKEN